MAIISQKKDLSLDKYTLDRAVVYTDIKTLTHFDQNARKHSKKQIKQIAASIEEFGFTNPVLIDQGKMILAGHGRVEAAKELGMEQVPCVHIEHLSEEQKRAYVLADNQLALNATWDEDLLSQELKLLSELDLGFDIELTGFSIAEIDQLIGDVEAEEDHDPRDDILPDEESIPKRAQLGDVWRLGDHRLICGNSLDPKVVSNLMAEQTAMMVFTDPPYNVKIDGHVGGKGQIKHDEFAMASGEMS